MAMDIADKLNDEFRRQNISGCPGDDSCDAIAKYKDIASAYSKVENAIAVLSDMRSNVSYVYYGGFSSVLGIEIKCGAEEKINSIWEENILKCIHPDDLYEKHFQELGFLHFMDGHSENVYSRYYLANELRMTGADGKYFHALHRLFYIFRDGRVWLSLCLYTPLVSRLENRNAVIDSVTGHVTLLYCEERMNILSAREKQVLELIDKGFMSKNIADMLSISVNTVSRHRQEILRKLKVNNSVEACRIAKYLRLI